MKKASQILALDERIIRCGPFGPLLNRILIPCNSQRYSILLGVYGRPGLIFHVAMHRRQGLCAMLASMIFLV